MPRSVSRSRTHRPECIGGKAAEKRPALEDSHCTLRHEGHVLTAGSGPARRQACSAYMASKVTEMKDRHCIGISSCPGCPDLDSQRLVHLPLTVGRLPFLDLSLGSLPTITITVNKVDRLRNRG